MRALTLTQPFCGLVASGIKTVENRPRAMIKVEDFGKPFALHASREIRFDLLAEFKAGVPAIYGTSPTPDWYDLAQVTSAVIGVATIETAIYVGGCDRDGIRQALERAGYAEQLCFAFGPTIYLLRDIKPLPLAVKCRGWQGFWTLKPEHEVDVRIQLEAA